MLHSRPKINKNWTTIASDTVLTSLLCVKQLHLFITGFADNIPSRDSVPIQVVVLTNGMADTGSSAGLRSQLTFPMISIAVRL